MLEGMLDSLSQPVAFASAPLVPPEAKAENGTVHARGRSSGDETGERGGLAQRASDLFASAIHATKPSATSPIDQTQVLSPAEDEELEELPSDWGEQSSFPTHSYLIECRDRHGGLFLCRPLSGFPFHEEVAGRNCGPKSGTAIDENTIG
jgi:hypothetical protein